jgi:hypothetical protein
MMPLRVVNYAPRVMPQLGASLQEASMTIVIFKMLIVQVSDSIGYFYVGSDIRKEFLSRIN